MRKKYKYSVSERREKHLEKVKRQHNVLEGCGETCRKKCGQNITNGRRIDINKQFWNMSRHDQKSFVMGCIVSSGIKRKTAGEGSRRLKTNKYYLKNGKTFFLTTLGYRKSNDKIIEIIMEKRNKNCNTCENWRTHIKKAELARVNYRIDAEKPASEDEVIFSVDLQKVIMLPRCEMFKSVIFTGRLVAYNESFVPVGSKNKNVRPMAVIWHEAIKGRKKEDIISTFYKFFWSRETELR
nr:unnamed protein product [Callosobruchus chinensis]